MSDVVDEFEKDDMGAPKQKRTDGVTANYKDWLRISDPAVTVLLKQALQHAEATSTFSSVRLPSSCQPRKSRYADSSEEDERDEDDSPSNSSSEEEEDATNEETSQTQHTPDLIPSSEATKEKKKIKSTAKDVQQKVQQLQIRRKFQSMPVLSIPLPPDNEYSTSTTGDDNNDDDKPMLEVSISLLDRSIADAESDSLIPSIRSLLTLSQSTSAPIGILLLRSGRFAAAIFDASNGELLKHTTSQRYTVRRGQGKAQSGNDGQGRKAVSMGAQLRRHGEEQLRLDIEQTLTAWKKDFDACRSVWYSCTKTMKQQLLVDGVLQKDDPRLRKVPLDAGRPTMEACHRIFQCLTTVAVVERPTKEDDEKFLPNTTSDPTSVVANVSIETEPVLKEEKEIHPELTELHIAAQDGNLKEIQRLIEQLDTKSECTTTNLPAGEFYQTPLHMAAASESPNAATCVRYLLEHGHADPTRFDIRSRPPYFLAQHDSVRRAFRLARGLLGEDVWDWDGTAKVGPALTEDAVQEKAAKEAARRKAKKARQKAKKATEKAAAVAKADELREQEAKQQQEAEAKRIREGLQPKTNVNCCDYCQKHVRRRDQFFRRLDYKYCCTDCVNQHKRELMAAAALNRLGG